MDCFLYSILCAKSIKALLCLLCNIQTECGGTYPRDKWSSVYHIYSHGCNSELVSCPKIWWVLDDLLYLLHLFGPQICWQSFTQSTLEVLPQCFSLVEFWILTGPLQHPDSFVFFSPSVVDLLVCSGSLFIDSKVIWYTEKFMVDLPVAAKQAQVITVIIRLLCSMLASAAVCGPRCCAWHSPNLWVVQMQFCKTMLVVFFLGEEAFSRQPFQNEPDDISRLCCHEF